MKWMQFLTPVAGMDTEDARAYLREHKEGTYPARRLLKNAQIQGARNPEE